jgi:hypothetical protein
MASPVARTLLRTQQALYEEQQVFYTQLFEKVEDEMLAQESDGNYQLTAKEQAKLITLLQANTLPDYIDQVSLITFVQAMPLAEQHKLLANPTIRHRMMFDNEYNPIAKDYWNNYLNDMQEKLPELNKFSKNPGLYDIEQRYQAFLNEKDISLKQQFGIELTFDYKDIKKTLTNDGDKTYFAKIESDIAKSIKTSFIQKGIQSISNLLQAPEKIAHGKNVYHALMQHVNTPTGIEASNSLITFLTDHKKLFELRILFNKNPLPDFVKQADLWAILNNDYFKTILLNRWQKAIEHPERYPQINGRNPLWDRMLVGDGSESAKKFGQKELEKLSVTDNPQLKVMLENEKKITQLASSHAKSPTTSHAKMFAALRKSDSAVDYGQRHDHNKTVDPTLEDSVNSRPRKHSEPTPSTTKPTQTSNNDGDLSVFRESLPSRSLSR